MYDHIGLKVKDLGASLRFYTAALAPLGYPLGSSDPSGAGFRPGGPPTTWPYAQKAHALAPFPGQSRGR